VIRCDLFLIHLSGNLGSHGICTAATNLGTQRETCAELPSCTAGYSTVPSAVQIRHPVPLGTLPYRRLYRSAILYRWVLYRTVGCTDPPSCTAGYSTVPSAVQICHPVPLGTLLYCRLYRSAILYRWVLYRTVGGTDPPSFQQLFSRESL